MSSIMVMITMMTVIMARVTTMTIIAKACIFGGSDEHHHLSLLISAGIMS